MALILPVCFVGIVPLPEVFLLSFVASGGFASWLHASRITSKHAASNTNVVSFLLFIGVTPLDVSHPTPATYLHQGRNEIALLFVVYNHVVDVTPLRVRSFERGGTRLAVLRNDRCHCRHLFAVLLLRDLDGAGVDTLEGHHVANRQTRCRIILAVELGIELHVRGIAVAINSLGIDLVMVLVCFDC